MNQYILLQSKHISIDDSKFELVTVTTPKQVRDAVSQMQSGVVALDFETRGTKPWLPNNYPVCVSLYDGHKAICLAYSDPHNEEECKEITNCLGEALLGRPDIKLIAHNVAFDALWFNQWLPNWYRCTYTMFKFLASEGWIGQSHSLKTAQVDLLEWDEKGDVEVEEWLVRAGHVTGSKAKKDTVEKLLDKWANKKVSPNKGEMWRVPMDILGYYNCTDVYSTWHLYTDIFMPVASLPIMENLHIILDSFILLNKAVAEAAHTGIKIDTPQLIAYRDYLKGKVESSYDAFLSYPDVREYADDLKTEALAELGKKEPPQRTKRDTLNKRWTQWTEKYHKLEDSEVFNPNSSAQLCTLFYERMQFPVEIVTKTNNPSVGKAALPLLGPAGVLLKDYKKLHKELEFVDKAVLRSEADGRIHPELRVPGTQTLRLSGSGGFSIHQMPKSAGFLRCWIPDDGTSWLSQDVDALEQVVLAELSGDEALLNLYGPDAKKPNDVYLYNGSALPKIGDTIRAAGYDTERPTKEMIDYVKKKCKAERSIAKLVSLAAAYGVGVKKLITILKVNGIELSYNEVKKILSAYWSLYGGVADYYDELKEEWRSNDGWILDALGIPMALDKRKLHDIGNSIIQRSGHLLLVLCVGELQRRRDEGECPAFEWKIPDFHDEMLVQCLQENEKEVKWHMNDVMNRWLNEVIDPVYTKISGEAEVITNFAEAKVDPEDLAEWEELMEELDL